MKFFKALITIIIVAAVVGGGVGVLLNQPQMSMQVVAVDFVTDLLHREEIATIDKILQSGSAEVLLGLSDGETRLSLEFKEYYNLDENEYYIEKIKFAANDFSTSGSLYAGEEYMYVSMPDLYADALGFVKGETEQAFVSSMFAYSSGSSYELGQEMSEMIRMLCRAYDQTPDAELAAEIEDLLRDYVNAAFKSLAKHADISQETKVVKIHSERVEARVITMKLDDTCMYNVLAEMFDKLQLDRNIPELIKKYGQQLEQYVAGTSLEGMIQESLGEDADEDLVDALLQAYDSLLDELEVLLEEMDAYVGYGDDTKIILDFVTEPWRSDLLAMEVSMMSNGEKWQLFELQFGLEGIAKTDKITLDIAEEYSVEFRVKQKGQDGYKSYLAISTYGEEFVKLQTEIDKTAGKFAFGVTMYGETYAVTGAYSGTGKAHTFDFKDVEYTDYDGETYSLLQELLASAGNETIEYELVLTLREQDKLTPKAKSEVKSAFSIREDDIDTMLLGVEDVISRAAAAFGEDFDIPEIDFAALFAQSLEEFGALLEESLSSSWDESWDDSWDDSWNDWDDAGDDFEDDAWNDSGDEPVYYPSAGMDNNEEPIPSPYEGEESWDEEYWDEESWWDESENTPSVYPYEGEEPWDAYVEVPVPIG